MVIDKKTNTVLLSCVTSFLEEFFPQYTMLILETREHHFRHPWNLESWLCWQEICVTAVLEWRPGCLGLSSHKKVPGSLTSSPHKVMGRQQWEPKLLAKVSKVSTGCSTLIIQWIPTALDQTLIFFSNCCFLFLSICFSPWQFHTSISLAKVFLFVLWALGCKLASLVGRSPTILDLFLVLF